MCGLGGFAFGAFFFLFLPFVEEDHKKGKEHERKKKGNPENGLGPLSTVKKTLTGNLRVGFGI